MNKTLGKFLVVALVGANAMASSFADENTELVKKAHALLSAQLGQEVEITTVAVEHVTWPNGALGCPRAGMNYTQSLVPGYRVVLKAEQREYAYHGREGGDPFYCAKPENSAKWIMDR